jgi:hypothetical protein
MDSDRGEGSTRKLLDGSSLVGFAADGKIRDVRVWGGLEASLTIVICLYNSSRQWEGRVDCARNGDL